jgi:predicted nucleotidyltransferase
MNFYAVLDQVLELLHQRGRVTYNALKRQFGLDDACLQDLKDEIIEAQRVAVDEDGRVLVWTGDVAATPPPAVASAVQPTTSPQTDSRNQRWQQIRLLCDTIAHEFHPDKIVLFGSYAYGQPHPDSDVDLLIVMPFEGSPFRQAAVILSHVVRTVGVLPLDLLVRTAEQVQARLHLGDSFMREIIERGRVLYSSTVPDADSLHASRLPRAASDYAVRQARETVDSYEADHA